MLFLWQNNGRPVLPLFKLIVSLVRLIITAVEHIFPLVLIAPLQSPWSSVTQGPFVLRVFNRLWALTRALFELTAQTPFLQRSPSIARSLLHSLLQNHSFFIHNLLSLSFHSFRLISPQNVFFQGPRLHCCHIPSHKRKLLPLG